MDERPPSPRNRPQFGIAMLMMLTTLVAVAAAGMGGLLRGPDQRAFFIIFILIMPGLTLIAVAMWQRINRKG